MARSPALCVDHLAPRNVQFFRLLKRRAIRRGCLKPRRPGTTSLVVVIAYDRRLDPRTPVVDLKNTILDDAVKELVIVFRPAVGREKLKRNLQFGRLDKVFEYIPRLVGLNMNGKRRVTVVDLDKVPSSWMGHGSLSPAALLSRTTAEIHGVAIRAYLERHGHAIPDDEKSKGKELLRFMTLEEYADEVGEEEFWINTVA